MNNKFLLLFSFLLLGVVFSNVCAQKKILNDKTFITAWYEENILDSDGEITVKNNTGNNLKINLYIIDKNQKSAGEEPQLLSVYDLPAYKKYVLNVSKIDKYLYMVKYNDNYMILNQPDWLIK